MLASIEGAARVLSGSIYKEGGINGWERSRSNFLSLAPRGVSSLTRIKDSPCFASERSSSVNSIRIYRTVN